MEPGDLEILGIPRDEILTRELVTARFKTSLIHYAISITQTCDESHI